MIRRSAELPWLFLAAVAALALLAAGTSPERVARRVADRERGQIRYAPPPDGTGRYATSPLQIPARGWWRILVRVVRQTINHRILTEAAGITFYALLSLFPAMAALVSLFGLFANPDQITAQLHDLKGFVPESGVQIIDDQVHNLVANGQSTLGFTLAISLATSLWSANSAMKALFDSLNVVFDEKEKRSFVHLTLLSMATTIGTLLFVIVAIAAVVALPVVLDFVGLGQFTDALLRFSRWPVLLLIITGLLAVLYRVGPSRDQARWRWATPGGIVAALFWVAVSVLFSKYVANFGAYNKMYGSLGAAIGFMTWIWLSSTVVLVGAVLDAETEHHVVPDTTRGPPQPLGQRGATKADTVAV